MTGVRVRSTVDRSILGLLSRLPEVGTGFSGGGLIGSTHATQRVARRFTRPRPPSFQDKRSGAYCRRGRHSDFAPRADDADGAHELGSHAVLLITKYMLDAGAYLRARRIGGLLRLTEFAIALGPAMNAALQAARSELFLDLIAAIGAVGPHVRSCVARIKNIFELLTVVHARVAHHVTAHEFVPAIDADMVLVTEIRAVMLLRPARVLVLLAGRGQLRFPVFRRLAVLGRFVLFARIVLLGRRHDRCVDDLSAHGEVALVLQEPVKQIEQLFQSHKVLASGNGSSIP